MQPVAHNRDAFETAWPRIAHIADEAGERGARLIVLPEGTIPAYVLGTAPVAPAQLERALDDLRAVAQRHGATIVCGSAKIVDGRTYNAAICIGPDGRELGHASKQFLWHFDRRWFARGDTLDPIPTPLGMLGLLVCADGRIPTIAATLVERGAQILVMPTAWVSSGRDPGALENAQADLMANVRAKENGVPFVVANKCGVERESVLYCGKSAIIDATGAFVARGSETGEAIVIGEVALAAPHSGRATVDAPSAEIAANEPDGSGVARARIAFTPEATRAGLERFARAAADADCDAIVAGASSVDAPADASVAVAVASSASLDTIVERSGIRFAVVGDETVADPRGLVPARLRGIDFFVWLAGSRFDDAWQTSFARTRAAELRAFVLVFSGDGRRAFAVDPDGAIVAGTFADFRLASFVYDRARANATTVAPTTDVMEGLRIAEAIRTRDAAPAFATNRAN